MKNNKRDFNLAAKVLLGLSIFSLIMGTITSFQNYRISSSLGMGEIYNHYLIEVVFNILMIWAAIMMFAKKKIGLIAFLLLGVLRMFATIPFGTNISTAYYLGRKSVLFFLDVGLLAIALCFRKNGISGWRAFLATDEWIETNFTDKLVALEKQYRPSLDESESSTVLVSEIAENPTDNSDNFEVIVPEAASPIVKETASSAPIMEKRKSSKFKLWYAIVCVVAIIAISFLYILVKPYPDYIITFSEKWNYTLKRPNNSVVERLIKQADTYYCYGGILIAGEKNTDVKYEVGYDAYRDIDDIYSQNPIPSIYVIKDTLLEKSNIDETSTYFLHWTDNDRIGSHYGRVNGSVLKERFERLDSLFPSNVKLLAEVFDLKESAKVRRDIYNIAASIPLTDMELFDDIYDYYDDFDKETQITELYDLNYKYNKNNIAFLKSASSYYYNHNNKDKAKEATNRILSIDGKNPAGLTLTSEFYADEGKWEKASEYAKKAIDYDGSSPCPYFVYAESLYKLGDKSAARRQFNIASKKTKWYDREAIRLEKKYREAGGCSFTIKTFDFGFKSYDGKIITNFGEKLYSSKSQYICPRISVKFDRAYENDEIQCKLYCRGELCTGEDSSNGYTYIDTIHYYGMEGMEAEIELLGWGSSYSGTWPSGNYRFEVYFNNELIGSETFHIY